MDPRLDGVPVVASFADAVRPLADVVAFYAAGSLATDDYRPGVSDLDLVAVIAGELDEPGRRDVVALHERTLRDDPAAASLHCVYVPQDDLADVSAEHLTWAHSQLFRRRLSGIARTELLRGGITVLGPAPAELLPAMDAAAVRAAARAELTGYWAGAVRKPWLWREDVYVDLGLFTLARVEAVLTEDRLITKQEALGRLHRFGASPELVEQIARRRGGAVVELGAGERKDRARTVRRLMSEGIARLTASPSVS